MSKNAFKVNKVLHLRPQDSLPADPENGDLVYQGDTIWFRVDGAWFDATATLSDPMTTRGDMIIRDSANTLNRLPVGAAGQVLKSDGLDVEWGDESAAGGKNYVLNPDAATGTDDVSADAGFSLTRTTTAAELPEESKGSAFKVSGTGLTPDSSKVAWAIKATGIDDADGGRMGSWEVRVQDISTTVSGEYKLQVYNVTDAAYVGDSSEVTSTGTYKGSVPLNGAADYELHLIALVAAPTDIGLSGVTISAESALIGALTTDWKAFNPSSELGLTGITSRLQWRLNGGSLEVSGDFDHSGRDGNQVQIGLPSGFTIKLLGTTNTAIIGYFEHDQSSGVVTRRPIIARNGNSYVGVGIDIGVPSNALIEQAGTIITAATGRASIHFTVPINEVNGSVMFGTEAQAQNARARFVSENESVAASSAVGFNQGNEFNSGTFNNSSGQISVPAEGHYNLNFMFEIPSDTSGDLLFEFRKNGSKIAPQMGQPSTSDAENRCASGSTDVYLTTSDYIEVVNLAGFARTSDAVYGGVLTVTRNPDKSSNATGFPFADQFPGEYGMTKEWSETKNSDGDFSGGTWSFYRVGNMVTVQCNQDTAHSSSSSPSTLSGFLPEIYRPTTARRNIYHIDGTRIREIAVQSNGTINMNYRTYSGSTSSTGSTGTPASITYIIES